MQNKNNKNYRLPKKQNKTFFFIFHKTQIKGNRNFKEKYNQKHENKHSKNKQKNNKIK